MQNMKRDPALGPKFILVFTTKILGLWIRKVKGLENLPKNQAFIIASNHCSYIEHFLIGSLVISYLQKKIFVLAKKEHYEDITQKKWHKFWNNYLGQIPIDRSKGEHALKLAIECLKKGKVLIIYPEGTRSLTGKIQKGKTGVSRLALGAQVPVVPLGIIGSFEILPKGKIIPNMKRATLNFGNPIYFNKYYNKPTTKKSLRSITNTIMKQIAKLSNQKYNF
tara:strand:+ start:172 stop:837 length:666 start_codon:yes stop_codon:yes gene_type:complete